MSAAILPVLLLILLGVAIRQSRWLPAEFFSSIEKFSFFIAFPALLFSATAQLEFQGAMAAQLALGSLLPSALIVLLTALGLLFAPALPGPSRSSVMQGAMRPNSYFGIAVGSLFFPAELTSLLVLTLALCLPVVNLVSVVVLCWWSGQKPNFRTVLWTIARNPIILSTLAGLAWAQTGWPLPHALLATLKILGQAALCLGLLCVGGGLIFSRQGQRPLALLLTSALKLLLMPLLAFVTCRALGLPDPVTTVACFYCALPTAPNAYIMARQMGGDAPLMASLITVQTLLAIVTVPLCMGLLG